MLRNRTGTFPSRFSVSVLLQNGITLDQDKNVLICLITIN